MQILQIGNSLGMVCLKSHTFDYSTQTRVYKQTIQFVSWKVFRRNTYSKIYEWPVEHEWFEKYFLWSGMIITLESVERL